MPPVEILTAEQMRRVDRRAIEGGIPSLRLMEAAGRGIAEAMGRDLPDLARRPLVILCGKGNNGGDGLVVARHLALSGLAPRSWSWVLPARSPRTRRCSWREHGPSVSPWTWWRTPPAGNPAPC